MEGYISEIRLFAGNFPPLGWAICNGAQLSIASYQALYVLIGTTYGGDGITTFNIPNLQGRVPVGTGTGPGLPLILLGQVGGTETVVMSSAQMPIHTHISAGSTVSVPVYNDTGNTGAPANAVLAGNALAYTSETADSKLKSGTSTVAVSIAGSSTPIDIIQPYLVTNYIICLEGIFPSRN
ncbi:phage tail protein [Flavobacterium gelatinilyticum]|uniref:phage tail protein n=1 Tax=Flavobacterium gelatinilyticum TaxID=3003260 RepID=UPI002480CFFA|nr:tail fiber protein [Flavobacterium gelatinilyticum]